MRRNQVLSQPWVMSMFTHDSNTRKYEKLTVPKESDASYMVLTIGTLDKEYERGIQVKR